MQFEIKEFATREELEKAFHDGKLERDVIYRAVDVQQTFKLSTVRKGLVNYNHGWKQQ